MRILTVLVETLRKPSTGLKHISSTVGAEVSRVETLRKPSTGLKPVEPAFDLRENTVETLRKPSTGLKLLTGFSIGGEVRSRHSENPARD